MSRAEAEEEKKKMIDKFFNYAEAPIKEWLAEYLNTDTEKVFPDYDEDSDDIGFQYKGDQYNAYLLSMGPNEPSMVNQSLLKSSEEVRKACSMLFDAVQMVMPSVLHTTDKEFADALKGFHFQFDEDTMSFRLIVVNTEQYKKVMSVKHYQQLMHSKGLMEKKLNEPDVDENTVTEIKKYLEKVDDLVVKAKESYDAITNEAIEKEDERCKDITEKLKTANKLYIVVEKIDENDVDAINEGLKRLPVFGTTFQDTEDESFVDKLKKEYDLKD